MSEEYERYSLDIAKYILIALQILGGNASRQEIKEKFVEDTQFDLTYHEVFEPYTGKTYSHFLFDFNFGLIALKCCNYIEPYKRNSNIILTQKGKNFNAQLYPTDEDKEIQQDYWQKAHNKKSNEQAFINWCTNHKQLKNSNKLYSESSAKDFTFMLKKQLCKKIPEIEKKINSQNIFIITDYELIDAILNKYLSEIDNIDKLANNADGKNSLILYSEFLKGNNCENPIEQLETYNKGDNMESAKYHPLNQILYGPPGTGKTYNTVIKAMEIITFENLFRKWFIEIYCKNKNVKDSEKTLKDYVTHIKKINEEYLINDNIFKYYDIASFKQLQTNILNSSYVLKNDTRNNPNSYYQHSLKRYEEFLYWLDYEKIRKEFDALKQQGQIEFVTFHQSYSYEEFVEGIKPDLKNENDLTYQKVDGIFKSICKNASKTITDNFDDVYEKFINDLADYNEDNLFKLKTGKGKTFGITVNSNKNLSIYMGKNLTKWGTLTKNNLKNLSDWKYYANPIYEYLKNNYNLTVRETQNSTQPYILIIDEINRGNISKIFGELITLIEEDKRETMSVKLPYSQDNFTVPKNLYIIGTMNTSDRSIASIDIALRRRFKFIEMMPKSELVADFGCGFQTIFEKLNTKIKILLDRDHQIGHSYFINTKYANADINTLKEIWFSEIIPLLNEYFYCDWEKLKLVIPGFIKEVNIPAELKNDCEDSIYEFKTPNEVKDFVGALTQDKFKQEN